MTLAELKEAVKALTGITANDTLRNIIQMAANELWDSVDLPNSLQEVRITTGAERYVTLPWQVYKVRGVKFSNDRSRLVINSVHPYYNDLSWYQTDLSCRVIRYVPLQNRITNASTLKFKARKILTSSVTFTVTGEVDNAQYVIEPITLSTGSREVLSAERYINIPLSITKNSRTEVDVDIIDASGNILGVFPNHLLEAKYILAQMYDRCTTIANSLEGCFDVLFKPHPPQLFDDGDSFPDPFSQIVIYKACEQWNLRTGDTISAATAFNEKAANVLRQFTADDVRGKTLVPNITSDPLITSYAGRI